MLPTIHKVVRYQGEGWGGVNQSIDSSTKVAYLNKVAKFGTTLEANDPKSICHQNDFEAVILNVKSYALLL